jgi:putative iron-dependent peroxidase
VIEAAIIGEEDRAFAGGSYVIVQKYLHDMDGWNALSTETQERIIGRNKLSDVELDDSIKPTSAHNALTTITENGREFKILRDNMPFGNAAAGEFGTYFIGYCRTPSRPWIQAKPCGIVAMIRTIHRNSLIALAMSQA